MFNMIDKYPKLLKRIAIGLIVSLLVGCANSRSPCPNGDCANYPGNRNTGLSTGDKIGIGIGAAALVIGLGTLIYKALNADENKSPETDDNTQNWEASGPALSEQINFSDLAINGYAQGGWPIAIDFQVSHPGSVYIVVSAANTKPYVYPLNGTTLGRQLKIFNLPAGFSVNPIPAQLEVHATDSSNGADTLLPITIFGIACGPRAVGSIGIDQVTFTPGLIDISHAEKANYSFFLHYTFDRVSAEFRKVENRNGIIQASSIVKEDNIDLSSFDESKGRIDPQTWDGRTVKNQPSKGLHMLELRAWYKHSSKRDWVAAFSPDWVEVKE